MTNEIDQEESIKFSITFAVDKDGFFRRSCPNCGRDFKTMVDEADLVASLQPAFRKMGLEIGDIPESGEDIPKEYLLCPYCEYQAESSEMMTSTFSSYLERFIMRECILPKLYGVLSDTAQSLSTGRTHKPRGLLSINIMFDFNEPLLPPRPISGPEPPDMTIVDLLCCNRRIKILDGWYALHLCSYCRAEIILYA